MVLRDYQKEAVKRIKQQPCIGIFSEQRTGKTPMAIRGVVESGMTKVLIVCPASLVYNWLSEWKTWTNLPGMVVPDTKYDIRKQWTDGALIINYEKLRDTKAKQGMWRAIMLAKPEAVILDEAHKIKTRPTRSQKAYTTQACLKLSKVPVRLALTGTPAPNKETDVFNILRFLVPDQYTSYWDWVNKYFKEETVWVNGEPHAVPGVFKPGMDVIFQQELDKIAIQYKRKDVMDWITEDIEPTIIKLPCTTQQAKYISELEQWFETEHVATQGVLDNLIRIRQVCGAPEILGLKGKSPKIDWLVQYIKDYPDKSILVFSHSTKLLNLCATKIDCGLITGLVPLFHRKDVVDNFQSGKIKVLLIQIQAGKEGLTLDTADTTVFLDAYPPAADYKQAKDRMIAVSAERAKPKELIHVMMQGTYDETLYDLVAKNISATAVINDYKDYIRRRN